MSKIILPDGKEIECEAGKVSDGYHSFDDLYEHRCLLYCLLSSFYYSWKSKLHADGTGFDGWFVAGMEFENGDFKRAITYHLPIRMWEIYSAVEMDRAPEWDGHTSQDVVNRIRETCEELINA